MRTHHRAVQDGVGCVQYRCRADRAGVGLQGRKAVSTRGEGNAHGLGQSGGCTTAVSDMERPGTECVLAGLLGVAATPPARCWQRR